MKKTIEQNYFFNWTSGGYNSVRATSREEALKKAKQLGEPTKYFRGLQVQESSLVLDADYKLTDQSDKFYSGMFD